MDITKVDLNAPAFGDKAQKVEDLEPTQEAPAEEAAAEPEEKVEKGEEEEKAEGESEEEPARVKYSRFKNVHTRAVDAETRADKAEREAEELRVRLDNLKPADEDRSEVPAYWEKLYGDSPEAKEAWRLQRQHDEVLKRETREEAVRAYREEREQEVSRTQENLAQIDTQFEALSDFVGRDLTDKEQSTILDIVDEYTPKDKEGNYLGAVIPFEKAWEIHELKTQAAKAPKQKSRDAVASLSSAPTQGETSITEKDKNFNPLDWNAWRKRI